MKKKFYLLLSVFLIILSVSARVFGDSLSVNNLQFSVTNISIITPDGGRPSFLSLDFGIYNSTETRKLDLAGDFKFSFIDEFGNNYKRSKPLDDISSSPTLAQSIYPKTMYTMRLAFELPVAKAMSATLQFDGSSLGIAGPVSISIALPKSDNVTSVRVTAPENGAVVEQGFLVHLKVSVTGPQLPDGIIIDAFNYTYEDHAPTAENIYDLNVPTDSTIGPQSVNVIAKWKRNPGADNVTASDSIILNIQDSSLVTAY